MARVLMLVDVDGDRLPQSWDCEGVVCVTALPWPVAGTEFRMRLHDAVDSIADFLAREVPA